MDDNVNSNSEFKGVNRSVQTGITEYYNMAHLWRWAVFRAGRGKAGGTHSRWRWRWTLSE